MAKKPKRPRDVASNAVYVMRIATGQTEETTGDEGKDPAAVARGRLGGKKGGTSRAAALSGKQRSDAARKAAKSRWAKPETVD